MLAEVAADQPDFKAGHNRDPEARIDHKPGNCAQDFMAQTDRQPRTIHRHAGHRQLHNSGRFRGNRHITGR